jgi:hypothetical protein
MNEIDQILSNIDKDDEQLFSENPAENKKNDEILKIIDSLDAPQGESVAVKNDIPDEIPDVEYSIPASAVDTHERTAATPAKADDRPLVEELGIFTVKGTKSWNRREPYIITLNADALNNDTDNMQKSFYFVEQPSDKAAIKIKIKQEIVTYLRRPNSHITDHYTEFIYKTIMNASQEMIKNFKLDDETHKLFSYHIGPLTMFKYIKEMFYHGKYGYCYKYMPGNKAAPFFPEEFIKEIILKWFEENINTSSIPFDSIQKYEDIKKVALKQYQNDMKIFNGRLEQLNSKLGPDKTISRQKLVQLKGYSWFGYLNIEIYRRFFGANVFM